MFYKYMVVNNNESNRETLYLYLNNKEEYAADLLSKTEDDVNMHKKIYNYIKNMDIKFNGTKVGIVVNGIVLATVDLSDYDEKNNKLVELLDTKSSSSSKFIDLNKSEGVIEKLKLEEYIFGVIGGEMPAVFSLEALKAQAVIARTYALKRLSKNLPITDFNSTQIYRNKIYLLELWQDKYEEYKNKINQAIRETRDEVLMFDDDYIDAYYHLVSNGKTEDSSNVLKLAYPYLVSVDSSWDNDYVRKRIVPNEYLSKLLNISITKDTKTEVLVKTIGHRVKYIKFDEMVFDGLILARRLGLNSNDYDVEIEDNYTVFTTHGYGHGLGLSKYGAEKMAKSGYNYKDILEHYYKNAYIRKEKAI